LEIIINTNTIWDSPPRARHQIAYALSKKGIKVTFISGNTYGKPGFERKKINENLEVYIPSFPISRRFRYRTPLLNEGYQFWLYSKLKKMFNPEETVVVTSDFGGYLIPRFFNKSVYFASDDYVNNVKIPIFVKAYTTFTQQKLAGTAGFTVATAKNLVNNFLKYNKRSFELPLGAPDFNIGIPYKNILRKRDNVIKVVLLGYFDKVKTPVSLLNKILANRKAEVFLIGPIKDDILDFLKPAHRVHALGTQTGYELLESLVQMDVAIAPYYMDDPNTGRTPNKMWQYLAAGKPAVITNLPNVQHWEFPAHTVYKANDEEEFVRMVNTAYELDSEELIARRIALAKENSWERRADLLLKYVEENFQVTP
jgi:hypothetical protein